MNSLQALISKMEQTPAALTLLLEDFCRTPYEVLFSDRNSLILANVLLRKYNKEIHNDIEITPEEVLLVRDGLSPEAVKAAGDVIDNLTDAFFQKIRTLHGKLLKGFQKGEEDAAMPLRFLLSLERECYIFLALIGRPPGHTVIKSAVKTYGNPGSEIYRKKRGKGFEEACLKHLRVAVRGLSRYEDKNDLPLSMLTRPVPVHPWPQYGNQPRFPVGPHEKLPQWWSGPEALFESHQRTLSETLPFAPLF